MSRQIPIIAVELDGVLGDRIIGSGNLFVPYQWRVRRGSLDTLELLARRCYVLIHSHWLSEETGVDVDVQAAAMKRWLGDMKAPWDWLWTLPGKPWADFYVEVEEDLDNVAATLANEVGAHSGS